MTKVTPSGRAGPDGGYGSWIITLPGAAPGGGQPVIVRRTAGAPGGRPIPGLSEHAIGFKGLADAIWLRNRIVENLEEANATGDHQRREELLTCEAGGPDDGDWDA